MIREKNLKALKECRPELYLLVNNTKISSKYKLNNSMHPKKYLNLLNTHTNKLFYNNGDPLGDSKRLVTDKKVLVPNLSVYLGMGLLYNLMNYISMFGTNSSSFIVIEKDPELFSLVIEHIDIEKYIREPRITFLIGKQLHELYTEMNKAINSGNNKFYVKAINFIEEPAAFTSDKEYYLGAVRTLNEAIKEVLLFFGNDPLDSLIGIDHTFVNIKEIIEYPAVSDLKDKFKGRPGIVVATGPSLDKNIHLLKGLENKAVICAVDASVRVMKKRGLKPHLTTSLERVEATSRLFEGLDEEDLKDIFLAACPVVHPLTYQNFKGERIVVYRNFATFEWLDIPKGILDIGPSSANMSFKLLEFLGCDPIILIGQDLAFSEDDLTHATGSTYGEREEIYHTQRQNIFVEGNYVPQIKTTAVWDTFRKHYMKDISTYKGTVINATEGGAKIHGAELMTFAEAIEKYIAPQPALDIVEQLKLNLHKPNKEEKIAMYAQTLSKVKHSQAYCEDAIKRLYDAYLLCVEYNEKVTKPYVETKVFNSELAFKLIAGAENANNIFGETEFFQILMHYVQSYYIRTMIEIQGVKAGNAGIPEKNNAIMMLSKDMFAVMVELIKKMIEMQKVLRSLLEFNYNEVTKEA